MHVSCWSPCARLWRIAFASNMSHWDHACLESLCKLVENCLCNAWDHAWSPCARLWRIAFASNVPLPGTMHVWSPCAKLWCMPYSFFINIDGSKGASFAIMSHCLGMLESLCKVVENCPCKQSTVKDAMEMFIKLRPTSVKQKVPQLQTWKVQPTNP